jgi:alkaline phosphatase D
MRQMPRPVALGLAGLLALLVPAAAADAPLTRIAFGSCADQNHPQPLWRAVLAYAPERFVFTGDNVYGDDRSGTLAELRAAYAAAAVLPGYRELRASVPILATWDDHDYGLNDAGAEFPNKDRAQALFNDFWDVPADDPRRHRPGVYHAEITGPPGRRVQVILLDTRYFRSPLKPTDQRDAPGKERYLPDPDPAKTMLGEAQWAWLADQLRAPTELRLLVSSIQVLAEGHGYERWGNLPRERARLLELIRATGARGVVILSGDRHVGALYRETEGVPYPLHEVTASGINRSWAAAREAGPNRLGDLYRLENFGTIDIDWPARRVTLALRGLAGTVVRSVTLALDALAPP